MPTVINSQNAYLQFAFELEIQLGVGETISGGFHNVTLPQISFTSLEYRAGDGGVWRYKFTTEPIITEIVASRGVFNNSTNDTVKLLERQIQHHNKIPQIIVRQMNANGYIEYKYKNCRLSSIRPTSDPDSLTSQVLVTDVTFTMESLDISEVGDSSLYQQMMGQIITG